MSRKFRVYKKVEKKYADNQDKFVIYADGSLWLDLGFTRLMKCDPDRYTVEYCTGLKDKNGVEIFEGDEVSSCVITPYGKEADFIANYSHCLEYIGDELEIIGNIHDEVTQ